MNRERTNSGTFFVLPGRNGAGLDMEQGDDGRSSVVGKKRSSDMGERPAGHGFIRVRFSRRRTELAVNRRPFRLETKLLLAGPTRAGVKN